jgi:hypothetical protein
MARRKELGRAYSDKAFHSKIICGDCGGFYGRKVWHSTDEYRSVIFQCNRKFKNEDRCRTPKLSEDEIKRRFLTAYNELMGNRTMIIADCELIRQTLCDTTQIDSEILREHDEMIVASELVKAHIKKNASVAQSQEASHWKPGVLRHAITPPWNITLPSKRKKISEIAKTRNWKPLLIF